MESTSTASVSQRLIDSKREWAESQKVQGREAGFKWANETADFEELVRIRNLNLLEQVEASPHFATSIADYIGFYDEDCSLSRVDEENISNEFALAFVEAAMEVFENIP